MHAQWRGYQRRRGLHPAVWLTLLVVPVGLGLGAVLAGRLSLSTLQVILLAAVLALAAQAHSSVTLQVPAGAAGIAAVVVGAPAAQQRIWDAVLLGRATPQAVQTLTQTGWVELLPAGTTGTLTGAAVRDLYACSDGQAVVAECQTTVTSAVATLHLDTGDQRDVEVAAQAVSVP